MNTLEGVEHDQISVARDEVIRLSTYSKFKKFIVLWVAAYNDLQIDVNPLGLARQGGEKTPNILLIDVPAESLSA